ncbi:unnamed protein product [Urochloa humidicola]
MATTSLSRLKDSEMVVQRGRHEGGQNRQMRIVECLVGDETNIVLFTKTNDQGSPALLQPPCYPFKNGTIHSSQVDDLRFRRFV